MAKTKSVFVCQNCGSESPKWIGKCYSCGEWNTFVEEKVMTGKPKGESAVFVSENSMRQKPQPVNSVNVEQLPRINTNIDEFNRVLGGGMVPGSIVLLGGEPGIGKSTLVLQMALKLTSQKILYVSGEESPQQIKLRADRLAPGEGEHCLVVNETALERIVNHIDNTAPELVIIDSVQTMEREDIESAPGSVSQIRECTATILRIAKERSLPVLLIGHINKEGSLAGPKVLEHMVDVVLQFEGDRHYMYRILRSIKNRFGSTSEIGIFEMLSNGLREVSNPSELLLSHQNEEMSGISIAAAIEGMRPFLIEVQALASTAAYGTPQRSSTGFDLRRLNMLLAVLEKRAGFKLAAKDVFLNIAGGLKVSDPAIDLAVVSAVLSSNTDLAIPKTICLTGEVGLSGEIRPVTRIEQRISEAEKLGFKTIVVPRYNKGIDFSKFNINVFQAGKIEEAFRQLFS
ncbi:DNA repair protein RadA [Alkalitalea saponilacus]|uniref:DNA repair protein RadA n=1 Tax=Alkalitalea saponilacus TaxID=889453 RepID=A0A1T5HN84_9BACT|nr:DNA repair protein RadA [Alkalitalea saponilacus]ASB49351.1 DNA repair protein RadA [Alkalitalea saponilacus]SKC22145.1 DNA repair protein RadA/Sms [Alkalitalea saponilacus]